MVSSFKYKGEAYYLNFWVTFLINVLIAAVIAYYIHKGLTSFFSDKHIRLEITTNCDKKSDH